MPSADLLTLFVFNSPTDPPIRMKGTTSLFENRSSSIQVNLGFDGHAGAQLIQVALIRVEAYPHRQPLYDLDIVSSRILGRKQAGSISSSGWHKLDRAIKRLIEGIHLNGHALPNVHLSELSLLKVRGRPNIVNLDHHDELLPLRNSAPDFRAALARDPVDRGHKWDSKSRSQARTEGFPPHQKEKQTDYP
jgi:hypothetical protein